MNLLEIAPNQLCEILRTDPQTGLSSLAVLQNRKEFGENVPPDSLFNPKSVCKSLFSNVLFCMFLALSIFSLFTENRVVATVCLTVSTVCYAVFYLYCMYKARPLSQAKRKVEGSYAVLRAGRRVLIRSREIVPGDLLLCRRCSCRDLCRAVSDSFRWRAAGLRCPGRIGYRSDGKRVHILPESLPGGLRRRES